MFHIRNEGEAFKSGFSFQVGGGLKYPYLSFHYVSYDFGSLQATRRTIRLRFKKWPCLLLEKSVWNHFENYLNIRDLTLITNVEFENLQAYKEDSERRWAQTIRKRDAWLNSLAKGN